MIQANAMGFVEGVTAANLAIQNNFVILWVVKVLLVVQISLIIFHHYMT